MPRNDPRLQTGELEIGYTEAVQRHANRHVVAPKPVSQRKLDFEHARPRWIRELAAEAMGVFFFVWVCSRESITAANSYQRYPGISSTASFFLNNNDPAFGSIFQIGWAFAIGIAFAIMYVQRFKLHLKPQSIIASGTTRITDESQNMWKYFWRTFQPCSNSVLCVVARCKYIVTPWTPSLITSLSSLGRRFLSIFLLRSSVPLWLACCLSDSTIRK